MILDTNAVSAFFEDVPAVCMAVGGTEVLAVPSIALGEFRFGLSGSRLRAELEARLGRLERLADVLCVDAETACHYAAIRRELKDAGTPIPENDLWIAALVRQHGLPLLSNDSHFVGFEDGVHTGRVGRMRHRARAQSDEGCSLSGHKRIEQEIRVQMAAISASVL